MFENHSWYLCYKFCVKKKRKKNSFFAEISDICHFLIGLKKKWDYPMAIIFHKLHSITLQSTLLQYWIKKWSWKVFAKKNAKGRKKFPKKRYFCCFFGFFVIFGALYSLSEVARARIKFFGQPHGIKEKISQFWSPYEQMLKPPILTPSEISVILKSTSQKNFPGNHFYHFLFRI